MILLSVGLITFSNFIKKSRDMKRITDLKAIAFAIQTNRNALSNNQIFTKLVEWGTELPDKNEINPNVFQAIKNLPKTNHFQAVDNSPIRFCATPRNNDVCLCVSLETYFGNSHYLSDCQDDNGSFQTRETCETDNCGFYCQAIQKN